MQFIRFTLCKNLLLLFFFIVVTLTFLSIAAHVRNILQNGLKEILETPSIKVVEPAGGNFCVPLLMVTNYMNIVDVFMMP